jgi:arabinogalactan endo-1,4-beta-galactosidase
LYTDVWDHTGAVLAAIKAAGVTPEWVQVGNETNNGMLWSEGKASVNMQYFSYMVTSGHNAAKSIFPNVKTVVHLSNGNDNTLFRWMFDGLKANGASYDVIGMSLYPETTNWKALNAKCLTNMNDMVSRYGKMVMLSEVGMSVGSPATCKLFVEDILNKTSSVTGGKGLGVFYWEPECYNFQGYTKGAWGSDGKPTIAMDAFLLN